MTQNPQGSEQPEPLEPPFLPDFCNVRMVFAVVITAELLAIVLTLVSITNLDQFATELSLRTLYVLWIALMEAGLLCLLKGGLSRLSPTAAGIAAWLLLLLLTLSVSLLSHWLFTGLEGIQLDWLIVARSLVVSGIIGAMFLRYFYIQYLWQRQVVAESQARFQALQSRIRPHFLFNSMNTIANLTRVNPILAEEVVEDLSDLFRAALSDAHRHSTLGDELELCRRYLRIEGERLGERLKVEWDLRDLPEHVALPPLILQPLIENAIYHGIEPATEPGWIRIEGRYRRNRVELSIKNSLPQAPGGPQRKGNRIALENTRQRLEGFFNGEAALSVNEAEGHHQVRVVFSCLERQR